MTNYQIITDPDKLNKNQWNDFVFNHPYGNAFQTPEMFEVYKKTPLYEPIVVAVFDNKKLLGLLHAVVQKEYPNPFGFISSRSIIFGGPLVVEQDVKITELLLKEYDKVAKRKAIYSQFRNFWEQKEEKSIYEKCGYQYEEHLNILIDLKKSEDELWKEINSKRRNEIRKAIKENVIVSISPNDKELEKCYEILQHVYNKARLPIPKYYYFYNLKLLSVKEMKLFIFVAKLNGEVIGCLLALGYKGVIYDLFAGSLDFYLNKCPNDLITWEIFKWGKQNGYILFDFGGAGKPNVPYGVRDYKKKFGGEMVEFGRYEKIHHPMLMEFAKAGFKVWQKVKF